MSITPLMPVYPRCDVRPVRGEGCYLIGERGERYLDFASGIAVNILGHGHPHLVKAIQEQAATLIHVSNLYGSPQGEAFAQRLVDLTFADTVFLTNSGAEAVECAIKTARRYHHHHGRPDKHELITFTSAFHGRTLGTISATNQDKLRDGFAPLLPGFKVVEFDNLAAAEAAVGPHTAGFLVEPIQGEGGYLVAPPAFLQGLRALTTKHGMVLIMDEVQSGMGRTGKMFAADHINLKADVVTIAKGIASGMPLGVTCSRADIMTWPPGAHASTFGGNPVSCAAANATIKLLKEGFVANAADVGAHLMAGLRELQKQHQIIGDVRGMGLMIGIELVRDRHTKERAIEERNALVQAMFRRGVLVLGAGRNALRLAPPLILSRAQADSVLEVMGEALHEISASRSRPASV